MSEAQQAEPQRHSAFFTLSLLIDSEQMNALLDACWPHAVWDQKLLEDVQRQHAESSELSAAINPMFDDIADRSRNLFLRDFLLDTPNAPATAAADGKPIDPETTHRLRNVCARFDLLLDHPVEWRTEGRSTETLDFGSGSIRFDGVLCRAFWMAHSNESLSYHLSLEVPYGKGLPQQFGLSMLQKVFFNTEGTQWLLDNGGADGWQALRADAPPTPLLGVVETLFEQHLAHLLRSIRTVLRREELVPANIEVGSWQRLVLRQPVERVAQPGTPPEAWKDSVRHRRLLVVLSDPSFFSALERARATHDALLEAHKPFDPLSSNGRDTHRLDTLLQAMEARVLKAQPPPEGGPAATAGAIGCEVERYATSLFLSGFLQNIVDFLEQDWNEVYDGLSPIYPAPDASGANEGFMLYATPSIIYEVVSSSRSLEVGQQWIGTCPYMFLVHMTALFNESLVLRYELNVSRLFGHLQHAGLKASDRDTSAQRFDTVLDHAYACIRDFRLLTFEQVHKHYAFNVFRYETEQTFFSEIERVRGVVARHEYWNKVLEHLTTTVDGLKQDREARFQQRIGGFGLLIAALGLIQLWLGIAFREEQKFHVEMFVHVIVFAALGLVLALLYRRIVPLGREANDATSWRRFGETRK